MKSFDQFLNESVDPTKFLTQEQIDWCNRCIEEKWSVSQKGLVVTSYDMTVTTTDSKFPVKFGNVKGSFDCASCIELISLEGSPSTVMNDFWCNSCHSLTTLEGAPKSVGRNFNCCACDNLVSLKGSPATINGNFDCSKCSSLLTLKGGPLFINGTLECLHCQSLSSEEIEISKNKSLYAEWLKFDKTMDEFKKIYHGALKMSKYNL